MSANKPQQLGQHDAGNKGGFGAWDLEEDKSNPITLESLIAEHAYKKASDDDGKGSTVGTQIPPVILRNITKLREIPGGPYEVNSDVIRDALYLGLKILNLRHKLHDWEVDKKLASIIEATGALDRINDRNTEFCKNLEKIRAEDDAQKAAEHLSEFVESLDSLQLKWNRAMSIKALKKKKIVIELLPLCSEMAREIMR